MTWLYAIRAFCADIDPDGDPILSGRAGDS